MLLNNSWKEKWTILHSLSDPKENLTFTFFVKIKCMLKFRIYKIQENKGKRNVIIAGIY